MKTLEQFCKQNKPKRRQHKLEAFKDEILQLYNESYTIEQIQAYLETQRITASRSHVYSYIKKCFMGNNKTCIQGAQKQTIEPTSKSKATESFMKRF